MSEKYSNELKTPQNKDEKKKILDLPVGTGQISKLTKVPSSELPNFGKQKSRSSSSRFLDSGVTKDKLERLPTLRSTPPDKVFDLFVKKIRQCRTVFDFTKALSEMSQKDIKQDSLLELIDFVTNERGYFSLIVYKETLEMISINLFRPLPPHINPNSAQFDPEEDEPILEDAWPHIQLVYELFLRFLDSPDFNPMHAKQFVTRKYVTNIVELFGSEDPRERDYLKTILHRIYGKFLPLRPVIRKLIKNYFLESIYETERAYGVCEILEIFGSIVNGFSVPLKEEHVDFLMQALLPLHSTKNLSLYHEQLVNCVIQYLEKDKSLTYQVVKKLLRYWPIVNSAKQVYFLSEIEEILLVIDYREFGKILEMVLKKIAKCIETCHLQVAEKALSLWSKDGIYQLISQHIGKAFPLLFESLYFSAKCHWHKVIRSMACYTLRMFKDMNDEVFNRTVNIYYRRYLEEAHEIEEDLVFQESKSNKLRRKSLLPIDRLTINAMVEYVQDRQEQKQAVDLDYDYDEETDSDIDWQSDSFSSDSVSDSP